MECKINKVITLEDSTSYFVFDHAKYKNRSYLFVNKLTRDKKDLSDLFAILEEKKLGEDLEVEIVEDEDVLEKLTYFFRKGLNKDLEMENI